jgi:hypothetical protein
MNEVNIYIHKGSAHMDEIFAVAILWLLRADLRVATVRRVEKIPDDFRPGVDWALDVGLELNPKENRYDHHQPGAPEGLCAAGLLCRELSPLFFEFLMRDTAFGGPSWFRVLNFVDTRGPFAFRKEFGALTPDAFGPALTRMMESSSTVHAACDIALAVMSTWWLFFEEDISLEEEAAMTPRRMIECNGVRIAVVESDNPRISTTLARLNKWEEHDPGILVSFDDRGAGMAILRRGDHPAVDLSGLAGNEAVEFAHKGGFICKTKSRMSEQEVIDLIATCVKKQ